jgi:glycosyltransferase involved in cell wall biosynthesis
MKSLRIRETVGIVRRARPRNLLAADQRTSRSVRALLAFVRGRDRVAIDWAEAAVEEAPDNRLALGVLSRATRRTGAVSREMSAVQHLRSLDDLPSLRQRERILRGKLRDSDATWSPELGTPETLTPASRGRVMHLHKAALPARQTGYTVRSGSVIRAQRSAGLDPFIVTAPGFPDGATELVGPLELAGVRQWRLPASGKENPALDEELAWTASTAAEVIRQERPALIHVASGYRGYDLAVPAVGLGRHFGLPVVYEVRGFFEELWASGHDMAEDAELTERRFAREKAVMAAADAVVTIADGMRDELVGFGIPGAHVTVIPNAVDETQFFPMAPDPSLRARYGLGSRTVIGYISSLDSKREAIDVLLRATAELVRGGLPVVCLIVGDGRLRAGFEALARDLGIGGSAVFTGSVPHEDVPRYYALIDVFVIPRRNERGAVFTTPLKPFEAMAMARPLLVSDQPALIDTAGHGQRGLSFRADDPSALAAEARRLIENPELRGRLGEAGRDWVVRERTWAANGQRYRELFDRIHEEREGRSGGTGS